MDELRHVDIRDIEIGDRLRPVDQDYVGTLAESIELQGLLQPIVVREQGKGRPYRLVAGLHRFAACTSLGWRDLPAIVRSGDDLQAELMEADENLIRHELNALDRAVALAARKELYEALYPETRWGAQGGRGSKQNETDNLSFSKDAAEKTGLNERSIQRAVNLVKGLSKPTITRLQGTHIAGNGSMLKELANLSDDDQAATLDLMLPADASEPVTTVREAAAKVQGRAPVAKPTRQDAQMKAFRQLWTRAGEKVRRLIIQAIEDSTGGTFVLPSKETEGGEE